MVRKAINADSSRSCKLSRKDPFSVSENHDKGLNSVIYSLFIFQNLRLINHLLRPFSSKLLFEIDLTFSKQAIDTGTETKDFSMITIYVF
jgi:phosphoribosylformimino-5-aminoimidazole carboxamide ribonucleotide (ProFAR) isomerase